MDRDPKKLEAWRRRATPLHARTHLRPGRPPGRHARVNPRNRSRRDREWVRAYHSKERVRWVKRRPCRVPGCRRQAENMHVRGGGVGRKAEYVWIADICRMHHREAHQGQKSFERRHGLDLETAARDLQKAWERHLVEKERRMAA